MSLGSAARWWFADRRTGRITIVQAPNALSLAASAAAVLSRAVPGPVGRAARGVAETSTVAWALDEAVRGVNPWRRTLGAGVLAVQVTRLARR